MMAALGKKLRGLEGGFVAFMCPGCQMMHQVRVEGAGRPRWEYNGDPNAPTFSPSVLVTSGHHVSGHTGDCWCSLAKRTGEDPDFSCFRCHSYVRDGRIQFLSDCTHVLAGQTVDLPDVRQ